MEKGKADLHIHTSFTDGMAGVQEILDHVQEKTDLDVIAITDHDGLEGAYRARELWARGSYRFEVVMGMEVSTMQGHLLALFIEKPVPSYKDIARTAEAVLAQDGLCIAPHPMSWLTRSLGASILDRLVLGSGSRSCLDGMEVANPTIAGKVVRSKVLRLNRTRYRLAETGGSDAHFLQHLGTAYTSFPGTKAEDLRRAILLRETGAHILPAGRPVGAMAMLRQSVRGLLVHPSRLAGRNLRRLLEGGHL